MIVELDDHSSFVFSHYYKRWQCIKLFKCFDSRSLGGEELLLLIFLIFFFCLWWMSYTCCNLQFVWIMRMCNLFELCVCAIPSDCFGFVVLRAFVFEEKHVWIQCCSTFLLGVCLPYVGFWFWDFPCVSMLCISMLVGILVSCSIRF